MNTALINSNERLLAPLDILFIAADQQGESANAQQVFASLMAEMNATQGITIRQGNTLYLISPAQEQGQAFFRALNADVPQNFLENSKMFIKAAQMAGYYLLVTQFRDPRLVNLLKMVKATGQQYYDPSTDMVIEQLPEGLYQAAIYMRSKMNLAQAAPAAQGAQGGLAWVQ